MTLATQAVLRALIEDPTAERYGLELSAARVCRIGRHHYQTVNEDNPENRRYQHRECVICGKIKEGPTADFPRTERSFMGGGGIVN